LKTKWSQNGAKMEKAKNTEIREINQKDFSILEKKWRK
jgi:hypothetical protein